MRLLRRCDNDSFCLTQVADEAIPPYAILSHTWGADTTEVTFQDLTSGAGQDKPGYEKIQFCAEQAAQDNLKYFWIDTCCIDKTNYAELSHAIRSMFRWYREATRCYVYLSDVLSPPSNTDANKARPWELEFRKSKWFTRGWTLQELLAPSSVEFFSQDQKRLGDKRSLRQQIHQITGIPDSALQGAPLSQFNVNERFSWKEGRHTKLEEDRAYSLLGLFDVYIPPIYGEGTAKAFERLMDEIGKLEKCMQDLHITDPRDDKKRIEETKGGLLEDSYCWILKNSNFQQWRTDQQSRLLWIKGDPGKGKTMLLCGIVNELEKSISKTHVLSYFFCQATDSRINNATAVLRGLLYMLVKQQPSLVSHIRKKHDDAGKSLFEDANAWVAISEIFASILRDSNLNKTYLVVDAVDECVANLPKLLDFIVQQSPVSSRVKWIVSSRNWLEIEERLESTEHSSTLCLELNTESVSTAVRVFIQYKVRQLAERKKYDDKTRDAVQAYLSFHADDTFLWVALVCQNLEKISRWKTVAKLNAFPQGLDSLYERMMEQIYSSDDVDLCKQILALVAIVYRPITLKELTSLVEMLNDMVDDLALVREVIGYCGSFLVIREGTVFFVHLSAKDYFTSGRGQQMCGSTLTEEQGRISHRLLDTMHSALQRDMCSLQKPGVCIQEAIGCIDTSVLPQIAYACEYWIDHLQTCVEGGEEILVDGGRVHKFLQEHLLHWLEAMSLLQNIPEAVTAMQKLHSFLSGSESTTLLEMVHDILRFMMWSGSGIQEAPLQVYCSALVFAPKRSDVRRQFAKEMPEWVKVKSALDEDWGPLLQTLEGHTQAVNGVAFSPLGDRLASASDDSTARLWNVKTGQALQTLEGHISMVTSVAFSLQGDRLATGSEDRTVKLWDAKTGQALQTLKGHTSMVTSVAFAPQGDRLASASDDSTARLWNVKTGQALRTLEGHISTVTSVAFSLQGDQLATGSADRTVKLWDAKAGQALQTLKGHTSMVTSVAFAPQGNRLASASRDNTVRLWDAKTGQALQTLEGHTFSVNSIAFSPQGDRLASASGGGTVRIWDAKTGEALQTLEGHAYSVNSVTFSVQGDRLASASDDSTVRLWDAKIGQALQTPEGHTRYVFSMSFSPQGDRLASASEDQTVQLWDTKTGQALQTLKGHTSAVTSVAFSPQGDRLASASKDRTVRLWNTKTGEALQTFKGYRHIFSTVFSQDALCVEIDRRSASLHTPPFLRSSPHHSISGRIVVENSWLVVDLENVLWLPVNYRPVCSAVQDNLIAFGYSTGKILLLELC